MWKNVLNFNFAKQKTYRKWRNVCRRWGGNETLATPQACSGQTMRIHFSSTQKTGNRPLCAAWCTVIHLPGKPCAVTQFLYLGILLPFHPLFFFFFVFFPFSSKISLPFPFSFNIFTYYNPCSLLTYLFHFLLTYGWLVLWPSHFILPGAVVIALCSSPVACWTPSDLGRGAHLPVPYLFITVQGFSRQEYWSGLPFSFPEDLPNPGIEPKSPTLQVDSFPSEPLLLKYYLKPMALSHTAYHHDVQSFSPLPYSFRNLQF